MRQLRVLLKGIGLNLNFGSIDMKLKVLLISALISISFYANSEIEYYDCGEENYDRVYFKFDLDAIDDISPDTNSGVRLRSYGEVFEPLDVRVSQKWFKVTEIREIGFWVDLTDAIFFINRKGGESFYKDYANFLGDDRIKKSLGYCKNNIKGENLNTFFKMNSELQKEREDAELNKIANQPSAMNWN